LPRKIKIDSIGKTFEFPDGTPDDVIDKAVREEILPQYQQQAALTNQAPQSFGDKVIRGAKAFGGEFVGNGGAASTVGGFIKSALTPQLAAQDMAKQSVDNARAEGGDAYAYGANFAKGLPVVGPVVRAGESQAQGKTPEAIGQGLAGLVQYAGMRSPTTVDNVIPKQTPAEWLMGKRTAPQASTVKGMAQMAPHEISGLEDIYRAAAPTGKNPQFRANLNAALPDLKAVAQDLDLKESKGGIISPDMRVRATVDALNARLDSIAKNERVAQIQRNAGAPVEIKLSTDARRGMEFLANNAGEAGTQQLAASALKRGTLPIEQADVLAQAANKYLKSYEKLTPDQKLSATVTNPKIGGLKELDKSLGNSLNNTLTSKGEVGLRDYERRYAGVSAVRDALQDRMNAAELDQPGLVKGLVRPVANVLMKGKTGIASASQAAVADIRTGKALQSGFKKLSSGQSPSGTR
jgi:hypothetical protein